jgi:hypothetical protein
VIGSVVQPGWIEIPTAVLLGSFSLDVDDPLHGLIRLARAGSPETILEILDGARRAITTVWPEVTDAIVVPVPRHAPGPAHSLVMAACEEIATARGWRVAADALRRTQAAPEGKVGGARNPELEARTLTWAGSTLGPVIVLVDDVVRTGATIRACATAVRASGGERRLLAIALARARTIRTASELSNVEFDR